MIPMAFTLNLGGASALAAGLARDQLEPVIIGAVRRVMGPVVEQIRGAAPVGKTSASKHHLAGKLQRSIALRIDQRLGIRFTISAAPYGHLVESGHRMVVGGRARRLNAPSVTRREGRARGLFFGGRLAGPASGRVVGQVSARPFAGPILEANTPVIQAAIAEGVSRQLAFLQRVRRATGR